MAGSSFFALLDDITTLLDDIAVFTKAATKKTAGVLSDDLALNAEQLSGLNPDKELPIVWRVFKGSLTNKCILVPIALVLSAIAPVLITILLVVGGAYLCFEGVEKLIHVIKSKTKETPQDSPTKSEDEKIKGAIRTDFILSAEIIVIALETIATEPLIVRSLTLAVVAIVLTVFIYGSVAVIVKIDDLGLYLYTSTKSVIKKLGLFLISLAPKVMKFLSFAGMIAMFLVGGGIIVHKIGFIHQISLYLQPEIINKSIFETAFTIIVGVATGAFVIIALKIKSRVLNPQS